VLYVFNKQDMVDLTDFENKWLLNQGICVSANNRQTLGPLVEKMASMVTLSGAD
jgi:GTP-binding protein HflX